jgi:hypothetical protein
MDNHFGLNWLSEVLSYAWTAKSLKHTIRSMGYQYPANITDMYLRGENSKYMAAAVMAVNQSGD